MPDMMVAFVSQCEKNALAKTRRVLDAFADRIGDNTLISLALQNPLRYRGFNDLLQEAI
jgi:CRISPR-associated endonuclease/helicase Cas3